MNSMFGFFDKGIQGTKDKAVWRGPGGDSLLSFLFTQETRKAESAAYTRMHTGAENVIGQSRFLLPGTKGIPHPTSRRFVEAANEQGEYIAQDGQMLHDASAFENERREYAKDLFRAWWVSDAILEHCTSKEFVAACARGGGVDGMPDSLIATEARPSICLFYPEQSEAFALACAKASWLILHHPDAKGRLVVGGPSGGQGDVPQTHSKAPRSGRSALADAVA